MAISDILTSSFETKEQAEKFFTARAKIMPLREDAIRIKTEVQAIIAEGVFNTVDPELKAVGIKTLNIVTQLVAAFDDADVADFLNWRP